MQDRLPEITVDSKIALDSLTRQDLRDNSKAGLIHESKDGSYWVLSNKTGYHVMVTGLTHSVSDSTYVDPSLAIARVGYLVKTHTHNRNLYLARRLASR